MKRISQLLLFVSLLGLSILWRYSEGQHTSLEAVVEGSGPTQEVDLYPDHQVIRERPARIPFLTNMSDMVRRTADESSAGLSGQVTDWNGFPVAGARVQLRHSHHISLADPLQTRLLLRERVLNGGHIARTDIAAQGEADEQGVFFVPMQALPTSVYQVVASAHGLSPERKLWTWAGESGEIKFRLAPGDSISGKVLDPAGRPIAGASVLALTNGGEGRGNWTGERELVNRAESTADGGFRMDVYPGTFQLQARSPGYAPSIPQATRSNSSGVALVLQLRRALQGRVEDFSGQPISEALISVWAENAVTHWKGVTLQHSALGSPYAACTSNAVGNFRVDDLPAGRFGLLTQKSGYGPELTLVDLTASWSVVQTKVQMDEGEVLKGFVLGPDRRPVDGALITAAPSRSDRLAETGARAQHEAPVRSAGKTGHLPIPVSRATAAVETDTEGFFQLDTLEATSYDLSVLANDLLPTRLEGLNPELEIRPLTIVLEMGSSLEGTVISSTTGREVSDALVVVGRLGHRRLTRTDSRGQYHVGGLPEGEIDEIRVQAEGYGLMTVNDVVVAGELTLLDLRLVPAVRVSGFVWDASGLPVPGAWVRIEPARDTPELQIAENERMRAHLQHKLSVTGQTDATGHFEIENVNPCSELAVSVRHPAYGVLFGKSFAASSGEEISGLQLSFPNSRLQ